MMLFKTQCTPKHNNVDFKSKAPRNIMMLFKSKNTTKDNVFQN